MNTDIRNLLEKYLENTESTADYTQVLEDLSVYLENPINLNTASQNELMNFPLITPIQAIDILNHRNKTGYFLDISELQVLGFSPELIRIIRPYVSIQTNAQQQLKDIIKQLPYGNKELITTAKQKFPKQTNDSFLGNLWSQNIRLRYSRANMYSFGFSAEKDAGEAYWKKGPDYYSAHASFQNIGKIKTLIVGDYVINMGQGLVMGSGIGIGKSAMVLNIKRNAPDLKAYRGLNEFFFLRGIATSMQFRNWNLLMAISQTKADGRLGDTSTDNNAVFSSLDLDGLHRTRNELATKGNLKKNMFGAWLQKKGKRGNWGVGANYFHQNNNIEASTDLYKFYFPTGVEQTFLHAFQAHTIGRFHVFSELAFCPTNNTKAAVIGALTSLGKNMELSMLYRNYESGFISTFSTAFGNNNQNENGFYTGLLVHFSRKLSLSFYNDFWTNNWLSYRIYAPGKGSDIFTQLDYIPIKNSQFYIRFRSQLKPNNNSNSEPFKTAEQIKINSMRMHISIPLDKKIEFQMRSENNISHSVLGTFHASMGYLQLGGRIAKTKTSFSLRYSLFNVPWYYARIYAFESQLQYDFGTMAFYGKGFGMYVLLNQKLNKYWNLGLRAATGNSISPTTNISAPKQSIFAQLTYRL